MNTLAPRLADHLHRIGAIKFGQFTLKDGRQSPFYVDLRVLVSDPAVLREVGQAMVRQARDAGLEFERIAGLPYAGLPIAVAMSLESGVPPFLIASGATTCHLLSSCSSASAAGAIFSATTIFMGRSSVAVRHARRKGDDFHRPGVVGAR